MTSNAEINKANDDGKIIGVHKIPPNNFDIQLLNKIIGDYLKHKFIKEEKNEKVKEDHLKNDDNIINKESNNNIKEIYSITDIINILNKNGFSKNITEKIQEDYITKKDKENLYFFETKLKGKKVILEISEKKYTKRGRKGNDDTTNRFHTRECSDNIIKKCKAIFFIHVVKYLNQFINQYRISENGIKLFDLDYKYVKKLKRDHEFQMLKMPLKDLISLNISEKYRSNKNKDANKETIESILQQENEESPIIKILNMTFEEWINIFTLKRNCDYYCEYNGLQSVLEKISGIEENNYFSRFIFYLYNYKRWFLNKRGRSGKEKKEI